MRYLTCFFYDFATYKLHYKCFFISFEYLISFVSRFSLNLCKYCMFVCVRHQLKISTETKTIKVYAMR